jgi:hypothetical protein
VNGHELFLLFFRLDPYPGDSKPTLKEGCACLHQHTCEENMEDFDDLLEQLQAEKLTFTPQLL